VTTSHHIASPSSLPDSSDRNMTKQSAHVKAHIDRNTGKLFKKKHQQKVKEEKCSKCGFLLKNKLLLKMHLLFEHEIDGETLEEW